MNSYPQYPGSPYPPQYNALAYQQARSKPKLRNYILGAAIPFATFGIFRKQLVESLFKANNQIALDFVNNRPELADKLAAVQREKMARQAAETKLRFLEGSKPVPHNVELSSMPKDGHLKPDGGAEPEKPAAPAQADVSTTNADASADPDILRGLGIPGQEALALATDTADTTATANITDGSVLDNITGSTEGFSRSRYKRRYICYAGRTLNFSAQPELPDLPSQEKKYLRRKLSANTPLVPSLIGGGYSDLFYDRGGNKALAAGNVVLNTALPVFTTLLFPDHAAALTATLGGLLLNNLVDRNIKRKLLKGEEYRRIKSGLPF